MICKAREKPPWRLCNDVKRIAALLYDHDRQLEATDYFTNTGETVVRYLENRQRVLLVGVPPGGYN